VNLNYAYLTVDELDVVWALSITVTGTILGTSLVSGVLGETTIGSHLREVQSTVQTARKVGNIDIESELLVVWLEHLILGVGGVHEVDTGTNVVGVWSLSDVLESQGVVGGVDPVSSSVVSTIHGAVLSASLSIGTERGIPVVTIIAVGAA